MFIHFLTIFLFSSSLIITPTIAYPSICGSSERPAVHQIDQDIHAPLTSFKPDTLITQQTSQDTALLKRMHHLFYEANGVANLKCDVYAQAVRKYEAQEIMLLTDDNMRISCLYFKRPQAKINLIYVPGYFFDLTPPKEWATPFAIIFEQYNILTLDWRSIGHSEGIQGILCKNSFGSNAYPDIQAALDFMRRENSNPTLLVGFCFGAAMIMHATLQAQRANRPTADGLVLNCVFSKAEYQFNRAASAEDRFLYQLLLQTGAARKLLEYQADGDLFGLNPINLIKEITIPCYFEHYSYDPFAILQEGIEVYNAATCPKMFMQSDIGSHVRIHYQVPYQYQQSFLQFLKRFKFL